MITILGVEIFKMTETESQNTCICCIRENRTSLNKNNTERQVNAYIRKVSALLRVLLDRKI